MKLSVPFVQLPLHFDAPALAAEVLAIPEASWKSHPQEYAGNSMLPLVAVDGDPDNESFAGVMRPTVHLQQCSYLAQVLESLGVTLGRTRLMRLSGHAEVVQHADQGYYWTERVRVHVPIVTQPSVRFYCGDAQVNMAAGECWIFDTWRLHRVLNDASASRIHLVVDTVGGERFWDMVSQGRTHDAAPLASARRIVPVAGSAPTLACESTNVPVVMNPWELRTHLSFLFSEALPHPQLQALQPLTARFHNRWRELWAHYGDGAEGRPHFRAALDEFQAKFRIQASQVVLRNQISLTSAFATMIGKFAVAAEPGDTVSQPDNARDVVDRA